jgi:arabinofuranosyltransferase
MASTTPRQAPPLFSPEPASRGRERRALSVVALAAICAVALALQLHHFWPFLTDDAYISLRYSQRLLEGHGLTWNDMQPRVEGYTNLLWVLLCAALGAIGMNLEAAAHLLGVVSTVAAISAVAAQVYRDFPAKVRFVSALIGCLALSLSAPIAVWALGGLEQPLLAAWLAWAAYFGLRWVSTNKGSTRDADVMGVLLGFALLTRADSALFTALFYLGAVLGDGVRTRSLIARARLLPIPILFFTAQEVFRHAYYGEWLPNTAYVKVAFTLHRLRTGLKYELMGTRSEIVFLILALVGGVALWIAGKRRQVLLLATISIGWLFYIVVIGGDNFPVYRHFVPALAVLGFMIAGCGLLTLGAPFRFSRPRLAIFTILTLLVLTSDLFAERETWERQGKSVGLFLRTAFGARHPLLVADAAGAVPYYAHMDALDPLGLNDYHIARHPIADRGQGWVGHELGDGKYVLDHKPDLILLSDLQSKAVFPADQQLLADPRFSTHYQLVQLDAGPPDPVRALIYIRRLDGRLGIVTTGNAVTVPAYLADRSDANAVRLIDGRAQLVIAPHGSAKFAALPVTAGNWKVDVAGQDATALRVQGASGCPSCVQSEANGIADITVANTSGQPAVVEQLHLTKR